MDHLHKILALHGELDKIKSLGNNAMQKKKYEIAVEHYSSAIDMMERSRGTAPDRELAAAIWSNRSMAFSKLKKYDEAWSDAQSCIRVYPDWYKGHVRLGKVYEAMNQPSDALECYDTALEKIDLYVEGYEVFADIINTYVILAKKIYESSKQDPTYHKARFLCSKDCLLGLCLHHKYESFLHILKMYWDSLSEEMKGKLKHVINPIMTAKLDSYQEEMIILCLEKGVLSIKEISSKNIEGKGLPCIIIYSATSGSTKLLEYLMTNDKYKEEHKFMSATLFLQMSALIRVKMDGFATSENVIQVYKLCRRLNMVNDEIFTAFKNMAHMEVDEFLKFFKTSKWSSYLPKEVADIFVKELRSPQKAGNNESKASLPGSSASKSKSTSEVNNNSKCFTTKHDKTSDIIERETNDSKEDVIALKEEISHLKDENKLLSSKCNTDSSCHKESPCDTELIEDRTVKFLLSEQDIKLELKLSKLTGVLEKMSVIKLL